jgi:hypothetical protein
MTRDELMQNFGLSVERYGRGREPVAAAFAYVLERFTGASP